MLKALQNFGFVLKGLWLFDGLFGAPSGFVCELIVLLAAAVPGAQTCFSLPSLVEFNSVRVDSLHELVHLLVFRLSRILYRL